MSERADLESLREVGLLPHQAQFIIDFLKPDSPAYHHLAVPPGMGKSVTVATLVEQIMTERPVAQVLVLSDRVTIREQYTYVLQQYIQAYRVIRIDRRMFRELEAMVDVGESPWQSPMAAIMTLQTAMQPDVAESLTTIEWDLVVIDRPYPLTDKHEALVDRLVDAGALSRFLLITAPLGDQESVSSLPMLESTTWSRDAVDWDDHPLFAPRLKQVIEYTRSEEEIAFLDDLKVFLRTHRMPDVGKALLLRAASSSLYAIEQSLLNRRNRLAHNVLPRIADVDRDDVYEEEYEGSLDQVALGNDLARTEKKESSELEEVIRLMESLDEVSTDTKLRAFLGLTQQTALDSNRRICVFSSFVRTISYLSTSLAEITEDVYQLTGAMSYEERDRELRQFMETGGVLIVSSAALTGLNWMNLDVDMGINYDLPSSPLEMERRCGIIDRTRRANPSEMYAFRDLSGAISFEATDLRRHGFQKAHDETC